MNRAQYIVRFDDVCPTMNWSVWDRIEEVLIANEVRPLLGVVPDNRDPKLDVAPADDRFWERVRAWQAAGWAIALHGYQHLYVTDERGIYGWNGRSEFAGLPLSEQQEKLRKGLAIFEREGLHADAFMAPNHSFDTTTLDALVTLGLTTITDGLGLFPHRDAGGITWVPVQLWSLLPRRFGVWTVCLHANAWTDEDVASFARDIERFKDRITTFGAVLEQH
jgi:predicted deacetylase